MNIYLEKVNIDKKELLYKLLQYSLYEESEFDDNEMNAEGEFPYPYFPLYFKEEDRIPLFIKGKETNKILGFVMINTYMQKSKNGHSIAEFLVIPKYRRNKIGKRVAYLCFDMFKGNWEVSPSKGSNKAYNFWKNVIDEYTDKQNEFIDGIFIFNNEKRN